MQKKSRSISGAAGVYFVAGELSRLGYIALPTIRNTQGIDLIVTDSRSSKTAYLQVKTNSETRDFWMVGKGLPKVSENLFYVFVNFLGDKSERPEYLVVPSIEVYRRYHEKETRKEYESLTAQEKEKVLELHDLKLPTYKIVDEAHVTWKAVRKVVEENGRKLRYDRGRKDQVEFPFCFLKRGGDESNYRDRWDLLFTPLKQC